MLNKLIYFALFITIINAEGPRSHTSSRNVKAFKDYVNRLSGRSLQAKDVSEMSIYYDLSTNQTITTMGPRPWILPGQALRLPYIGLPCSCSGPTCGCCVGIRISQLNIDRHACANFTYDPYLFALFLDVYVNNEIVYHNSVSAKNPPPLCIPVPLGAIPGISVCLKLFEIYQHGNNIHFCVDLETQIFSAPVLVLHFDCVQMGQDGVVFCKPAECPTTTPDTGEESGVTEAAGDIFDEVTENKLKQIITEAPYLAGNKILLHIMKNNDENVIFKDVSNEVHD